MKQILVSKNPYLSLLKVEIKKFNKDIEDFCQLKMIEPSISNYLNYKEPKDFLPKNINRILAMRFPKFYLCSSIEFWDFVNSLPSDFRSDIIMLLNLKKIKIFLNDNLQIVDYLKRTHGSKYYNLLQKDLKRKKNV